MVGPLTAGGYRVVRFDTRGYGSSTTDDVEFSLQADVIAVFDALGIGRAALVGNSRGGRIALDTAIDYPDRIVAVVGVAAGLGGFEVQPTGEEIPILEAYDLVDSAEPFDPDALTDFETQVWLDGPGQPPDRVHWTLREMFRMMARPLNEPGRVRGREIRLDPPGNERLADLRCPVLAVAGTLDFSDVVQTAQRLEAAAPNARALIWDDVAHMVGMEQPDRLAATIVEFLAPLERWS
jgi:pimeloyl-ACP methyl ester carboxylesterase